MLTFISPLMHLMKEFPKDISLQSNVYCLMMESGLVW